MITGDILNSLRTTGKTLCVVGDGYTLQVSGKDVKNTTSEMDTSHHLDRRVEQGLEFVVNDGKTVFPARPALIWTRVITPVCTSTTRPPESGST